MSISFGIPAVRQPKEEMFPNQPVVTLEAYKGKGFACRFLFNKSALETLQVNPGVHAVNFAFDDTSKEAYVGKQEGEDAIIMAKNKSVSNKRFYEYIIKNYELDNSVDNYMELTSPVSLDADVIVFKLTPIVPNVEEVNTPEPVKDVEIEHLVEEEEKVLMSTGPHNDNYKTEPLPHGHWDGVE